jgi:hypothetical protein
VDREGTCARGRAIALAALASLFLARVLGQFLVALEAPAWLPPMDEWQSGLLPYRWLLPAQVVVLALQAQISVDLWHGRGAFALRRARLGGWLRGFSYLYCGVMIVRYLATMVLVPEQRWLGDTIPIVFHLVLASYIYVWSGFHQPRQMAAA